MRGPHDDEVLTVQASATPAAATAVAARPIPGGQPLVSAMAALGESIAGEASIAQAYIGVSPAGPPGPGPQQRSLGPTTIGQRVFPG